MIFSHPLGLTRTQWHVLLGAHRARSLVPNGFFLAGTTTAVANACDELQRRGYLRHILRTQRSMTPDYGWPIVVMSRRALARYNADLAAVREAQQ